MEHLEHAVDVKRNGSHERVPLPHGATVDFAKDPTGTVRVELVSRETSSKRVLDALGAFFVIFDSPAGVFYRIMRGGPMSGRPIHLGRQYRLRSRRGGSELLRFRVDVVQPEPPSVPTVPASASPPAPSTSRVDPDEPEDIEVDEVGGEEMQHNETGRAPQRYGDRFKVDLSRIADVKLIDLFGGENLDRHAVDNKLWRLLVERDAVTVVDAPSGGDDLRWQVPVVLTDEELQDPGPDGVVLDFDTLGWTWVNFAKVKGVAFRDVLGTTVKTSEEASCDLWDFIERSGLVVRKTR